LAPPAIDVVGPIPYLALQGMFDASAPKGIHSYWKTEYLSDLSDAAINTLVDHSARMKPLSPFAAVHIHHWEGAVKRQNAEATAFAYRDVRYVLNIVGLWMEPGDADQHVVWVRDFAQAIQPFATGQAYLNFLGDEGPARVKAAYGAERYGRLVALKDKYDPTNLFRLNQNIRPSQS
jgi:FAD/FMN-containing dehydrogenase